jgi:choline-sulfatase
MIALVGTLLLVGCSCARDWRVGDPDPPNILLIVVDTLRADHLGLYGYERPTSPNLDAWALRSTVFDRAYSHSPWTMPSVASILTGLEPREHGITDWQDPLEQQFVTLAEVLQGHGYRTGAAVSHYILAPKYHFDQGFEVFNTGAMELGSPHDVLSSPHITHMGKKLTKSSRGEPWFVMLHYFDPHAWYQPHPEYGFGETDMDLYDGEIAFTDHHIGDLLQRLEAKDTLRDTIVVLVADHGEAFNEHGHDQHTLSLYEELIRVPLIIQVPGFEPRRHDPVVAETQLAPTLLALAGLPPEPSFRAPALGFDATGFLPSEDFRVFAETKRSANAQAVVDGDWKYIDDRRRRRLELYDLEADPGEQENLRHKERVKLQDLRGQMRDYRKQPRHQAQSMELEEETVQALQALGYMTGDESAQLAQEDAETQREDAEELPPEDAEEPPPEGPERAPGLPE